MNIIISNSSDIPIYQQIVNQMRESIISNNLEQGQSLPSIRSLAKDLNISVITTKRAYEELELDGFIETVVGKGSFVARKNIEIIKEEKLRQVEEFIQKAVDTAKEVGISIDELREILDIVYGGE